MSASCASNSVRTDRGAARAAIRETVSSRKSNNRVTRTARNAGRAFALVASRSARERETPFSKLGCMTHTENPNQPEPMTYTENGHSYSVVCAWCIEEGNETPAVRMVEQWPACTRHAEAVA